jgi:SAM-dependent methyltransferase
VTVQSAGGALDARNTRFWDELCGSSLAREVGVEDASAASLERFDDAYMRLYPYLWRYLPEPSAAGLDVLEVGLGYGTVGQILAGRGVRYHGLDIAPGPVAMMRHRLELLGQDPGDRVVQGSVLEAPFGDERFDRVYSIGCIHHTGDLPRAVAEIHRLLRPGGRAVVMVYNRRSFRRTVYLPVQRGLARAGVRPAPAEDGTVRDLNLAGEAAPHTDQITRGEAKRLFGAFSRVRVDTRGTETYTLLGGRIRPSREVLLATLGRTLGADLYITAEK